MDTGVRYLIHMAGTPRIARQGSRIVSAGQWWNRFDNEWQDSDKPRDLLTVAERATYVLPTGGEWVECLICNGGAE